MSDQVQTPASAPSTPTTTPTTAPEVKPAAAAPAADAPLHAPGDKTTEAPPADAPKIEVAEGVSKHFAELERRKAAQAAKEKAHAERLKAEEPDRKAFEEWKAAKAAKNPLKLLEHAGMTQAELADALLSEPAAPDPVAELRAKVEALEKEKADQKAADELKAKRDTDAKNIAFVQDEIKKTLAAPEFKLTAKRGQVGVDLVFDTMTNYFLANKQVLPYARACQEVEKYLRALAADAAEETKPAEAPADAPKAPAKAKEDRPHTVTISNKTNADTPPRDQPSDSAANKARAIQAHNARMAAKRERLAGKAPSP
jgi:hypothetical protein